MNKLLIGLSASAALIFLPLTAKATHEPPHPYGGALDQPSTLAYCLRNYNIIPNTNPVRYQVGFDCHSIGPFTNYATCKAIANAWIYQLQRQGANISWQSVICAGPVAR